MILQALKEYYDRKAAELDSGIAPFGWEWKEIPFVICIDNSGALVNVEHTVGDDGKAKPMLVPRSIPRSGSKSYETVFFLWDHRGYVLGYPEEESKSRKQHAQWIKQLNDLASRNQNILALQALKAFYDMGVDLANPLFKDCLKEPINPNIGLRVGGRLVYEIPEIMDIYNKSIDANCTEDAVVGRCLVTGEMGRIARKHHDTPINKDSKKLISFQKGSGYDSFGKEQGYNAPISERAEFAYTTALNILLGNGSRQKIVFRNQSKHLVSIVFWSEKPSQLEDQFADFFDEDIGDNPDKDTALVRALYDSIRSGAFIEDDTANRFYVLGLSPSSARISIRFFISSNVGEIAKQIRRYFQDMEVVRPKGERENLPMVGLLKTTASQGSLDNINPRLSGEMMRSILSGLPFPETLLQAVLVRIKAEREVGYPRAKLVKGYLCRKFNLTQEERKKLVSLNRENTNVGYRLGRLFATLEKIQKDALGEGVNATIRDRFYAAASSSPVTVFGNLMRMSNHWLAKVESDKPGLAVVRKQLIGEITDGIAAFPAHLAIVDQGYFALGDYHQQQDFYTKKDSNKETVNQKGSEE